jgi:AcrR family transcriptional regulator
VAEIKELAWAQVAESGAGSLSLRAIARDMGMTSSALYRYFPSRDRLVQTLGRDGFASLADRLEAVEAEDAPGAVAAGLTGRAAPKSVVEAEDTTGAGAGGRTRRASPKSAGERFLHITDAYRTWALEHPTQYTVMFGGMVPGLEDDDAEVKAEMDRGVAVLFRVMMDGVASGEIKPPALVPGVERRLRPKLRRWLGHAGDALPPEALAACMVCWTQLHGSISLELFRHLPEPLMPADDLFEHAMRSVLTTIGCQM